MAQTYDIYLRKGLTEFNLIIKNLPNRDGMIIYNRLYLDAMVNYLSLQKKIIGRNNTSLSLEIDHVIEKIFNIFKNGMYLDASVEMFAGKPIDGSNTAFLDSKISDVYEESFAIFQNFTNMVANVAQYDLSKSIGSGANTMYLSAESVKTLKEAFEKLHHTPLLNAEVTTSAVKQISGDWKSVLKTSEFSIFYMLAIQAEAVMNLFCSADTELWYSLGAAENYMVLSVENSSIQSEKFMTYQNFLPLITEINGMLECFITPLGGNLLLSSTLNASMRRPRVFSEVDDLTWADLDNLTLDELDYVILA